MPLFSVEMIVYTEIQRPTGKVLEQINEFSKFVVHVQCKKLYFRSKQLVNILQGQRPFIIA